MLLYYITDRTQFNGNESRRRTKLLLRIEAAVEQGVDFIQLREKDLSIGQLESLSREVTDIVRASPASRTKLLINSRVDVAIAVDADGVHLRANDLSPHDVRKAWPEAGSAHPAVIGVSCHTESEVAEAARTGADFAVFGSVFQKKDANDFVARGIDGLHLACAHGIAVLALGGVTVENAAACRTAGAEGIAGIRLFQEGDLAESVAKLRRLG